MIKHTLHLISSNMLLAISGVLFWWIAARMYSVEDIGLASALISVTSLFLFLSSCGVGAAMVRYIPTNKDKGKVIGSLAGFSIGIAIILSAGFSLGVDFFMPKLHLLKTSFYPIIFVLFVCSMHVFQLSESIFISFKQTKMVLFKNAFQNFGRIGILFVLTGWGGFGLYAANCVTAFTVMVLLFLYFLHKGSLKDIPLSFDLDVLKKMSSFSLVNFLNAITFSLPGMLFPLIILSCFSSQETGYFYIPWMMFSVYCGFIKSVLSVFFMEASHGRDMKSMLRQVITLVFIIALVGWGVFAGIGDKILLIFNKEFSFYSFEILKLLFASLIFFSLNQLYLTVLNIKKEVLQYGLFSMFILITLIIFAFLFIPTTGSEGIARAWLVSNFLGSVYIFIAFLLGKVRHR